jgi:hypothetical protein
MLFLHHSNAAPFLNLQKGPQVLNNPIERVAVVNNLIPFWGCSIQRNVRFIQQSALFKSGWPTP